MSSIKQLVVITIFAFTLISSPTMAAPTNATPDTKGNANTESNADTQNNTGTYIKAGGLCVGGAILGSFIPVLGNIVGCAIGATAGYFWGDSDSTPDETPAIALDT